MPDNFPGPYEVEIKYTTSGRQHTQRLNTNIDIPPSIGADPTTITLQTRDGVGVILDVAVKAFVNTIKVWFHSSTTFDSYNLYLHPGGASPRVFYATGALGIAGTSAVATNPAHQQTYTFKTLEGGVMKIILLESGFAGQTRVPYASLGAGEQAFMDSVVAGSNWILARDSSYPIIALNGVGGQNEVVWRKIYR